MKIIRLLAIVLIMIPYLCRSALCQAYLLDVVIPETDSTRILYIDCKTRKETILPYNGHLVECKNADGSICIADESKKVVYILSDDLSIVETLDIPIDDVIWITAVDGNAIFYISNNNDRYILNMLDKKTMLTSLVDIPEYICKNSYTYKDAARKYGIKCISYNAKNGILYGGSIIEETVSYRNNDGQESIVCEGICPMWLNEESFLYFYDQALYVYSSGLEPTSKKIIDLWDIFEGDYLFAMETVYCSNVPKDNYISFISETYSWFEGLRYVIVSVDIEDGSFSKYKIKTQVASVHPGFIVSI